MRLLWSSMHLLVYFTLKKKKSLQDQNYIFGKRFCSLVLFYALKNLAGLYMNPCFANLAQKYLWMKAWTNFIQFKKLKIKLHLFARDFLDSISELHHKVITFEDPVLWYICQTCTSQQFDNFFFLKKLSLFKNNISGCQRLIFSYSLDWLISLPLVDNLYLVSTCNDLLREYALPY